MILCIIMTLIFCQTRAISNEISNSLFMCPTKCMCYSQSQITCNNVELSEIPSKFLPLIESFSLSNSNISIIKTEAFSDLKNVRKLHVEGPNIVRIIRFAFKGLGRLRELSVQQTSISILEKFSFSGLQNLTAILLQHNRIQTIESSAFAGTSNVRLILLLHNPLHIIESKAFSNLRNVEHILFPSGIKNIQPDAFNGLDSVGLIKLKHMDLTSLRSYTFRGLTQVHLLTIQESDLGVVEAHAFEGLINVGSLLIVNNKIDFMPELKITSENKIRVIRLLGNHVLQTPSSKKIVVEVSENFTVVSNHFPCDCRIYSILESPLANNTSFNFTLNNYCISPLELHGQLIGKLKLENIEQCFDKSCSRSWHFSVIRSNIFCLLFFLIILKF